MANYAYSFQDVVANIKGNGGSFSLGSGAGVADEGITIEGVQDDNIMKTGADGSFVHSHVPGYQSTVTVRLMKNSDANNKLMTMYNLQKATRLGWGLNVISLQHTTFADNWNLAFAAFKKKPTVTYAKEADLMEWTFDVGAAIGFLGTGLTLL